MLNVHEKSTERGLRASCLGGHRRRPLMTTAGVGFPGEYLPTPRWTHSAGSLRAPPLPARE